MPSIVRYRKVTDDYTTHRLREPVGEDGASLATELCTLVDGYTYVVLPDGVDLPAQPAEISVEPVVLTDDLRAEIKAASPHTQLIRDRRIEQIRARYSLDDELYLARIAVGHQRGTYTPTVKEEALLDDYQAYVEGVRAWAEVEYARLGL